MTNSPSAVSLTSKASPQINFDGSSISLNGSGKTLAAQLTNNTEGGKTEADIGGTTKEISEKTLKLFNTLFKYLAPTIVLWIGVTTAPGMMGQMAGQAFGAVKGFITTVGIAAGAAALMPYKAAAYKGLEKVGIGAGKLTGGAGKIASRMEEELWKKRGLGGKVLAGLTSPIWGAPYALTKSAQLLTPGIYTQAAEWAKKGKITIPEDLTIADQEGFVRGLPTDKNKLAAGAEMIKEGTYQKTTRGFREEMSTVAARLPSTALATREDKERAGEILKTTPEKITKKLLLDLQVDPQEKTKVENKMNEIARDFGVDVNVAAKAVFTSKLKPEEIKNIINKEAFETEEGLHLGALMWRRGQLAQAAPVLGPKFAEAYSNKVDKNIAWFVMNNPESLLYLYSSPAQYLGYYPPKGLSKKDVVGLISAYRTQKRAGP